MLNVRRHRLVAVLLAPLAALAVVAVPLSGPSAAASDVQLRPETAGDTATRQGRAVLVEGEVPPGELRARLVAVRDGGEQPVQEYSAATIGQPASSSQYLRNDDGRLTGRLQIGCPFGDEAVCGDEGAGIVGVRLVITVGGTEVPSSVLPVDFVRPSVQEYRLVTPTRIEVRFGEPVRGDDSPLDWTVRDPDAVVVQVRAPAADCAYLPETDRRRGRTGCTRLLDLSTPVGEDADPLVSYAPALNRPLYIDDASNRTSRDDQTTRTTSRAVDALPPALPSITAVAGRAPSGEQPTVAASDVDPVVQLGNLTPGHEAQVVATAAEGGRTVSTAWVEVAQSSAELTLPPLGQPGQEVVWTLRALARDARNTSTGRGDGPRPDGEPNPVRYDLDALAPRLLGAHLSGDTVQVRFSESLTGPDRAADWTYLTASGPRVVTSVSGSGSERRLSPAAPAGAVVRYRPTGERYVDRVGNPLPDSDAPVSSVPAPVVTSPVGLVHTRDSAVVVRGTAAPGEVEISHVDAEGRPTGPVVARARSAGGAFAVTVPLAEDARYEFVAVLVQGSDRSAATGVPPVVRDTVAPAVTLSRPAGGEVFPGASRQQVEYTVRDANPVDGRLLLSLDGGRTETVAGPAPASQTTAAVSLPAVDTTSARLRLAATDLAGNTGQAVSGTFTIDATPPVLSAVTVDSRTVLVRLSEPVSGSSTLLDWRVKGERVSSAEQTSDGGVPVVRLTTAVGVTIGADEQPVVAYEPAVASAQYRDRAGQAVVRRQVSALDRIRPLTPTVSEPSAAVLTRESTQRVVGRATPDDRVELLDPFGGLVAGPVVVAADGTWALDVPLARDAANDVLARAADRNGNRSTTAVPVARIEQDGTDPVVRVEQPAAGTRLEPGQRVAVRWSSTDRNLQEGATTVETSTDGGATWALLAERQPSSGSATWTVPSTVTPDARVRVSTTDRAGRTGRATAGPLGIGTAPAGSATPSSGSSATATATASPTASSTASPTATSPLPPLPPLQVAVPDDSIVPGQTAAVSVSGRPGARVELQAYSRPSTTYVTARTGVLDSSGRLVWSVRPGTNTRLFVRDLDGRQGDSRTAVVGVRTALSLTVLRNGRRDYTFQGRILPRRAGQLITLYRVERDGRRVITAQLRTDATGTYRLRRVFTGSGRFGFLTRTGANLTNQAGESNDGRARPTDVF